MARTQHPPRAADRLVHFHAHRHSLVIPQRDLELDLVDISRNLLEVCLIALGDDVEGVADLEVQRFVFWRVADAVLTHELHAALRISLVDAHSSRRHRHPQSGLLLVFELVIDLNDVLDRRSRRRSWPLEG